MRPRTCFVIQPFDSGEYDQRYDQILSPAIRDAGLEPYRVDRNPAADVPVDEIENGIREATVCLADISDDNPNVWYEVGYAFACRKRVCLISSRTSARRPFDIRHRAVIEYAPDRVDLLRQRVTGRIKAIVENDRAIKCSGIAANLKSLFIDPRIEKSERVAEATYQPAYRMSDVEIIRVGDMCQLSAQLEMQVGGALIVGHMVGEGPIRNAFAYLQYHVSDLDAKQEFRGFALIHLAGVGDLTGYWIAESVLHPGTISLGDFALQRVQRAK